MIEGDDFGQSEEIGCRFSAGKSLGITFEWDAGLKVSVVHPEQGSTDVVDEELMKNKAKLTPDYLLLSVNGNDVSNMSFEETVALLRSLESQHRILVFSKRLNSSETVEPLPEDDESSIDSMSVGNNGGIQSSIYQVLIDSSLKPVHVKITNLSYWYRTRKALGARKQLALIVQQNNSTMRYESYMFVLKPREEDGVLAPARKFLSTHMSKWSAFRNSESRTKERDSNPYINKKFKGVDIDPSQILTTHLKILVVSDSFYRMSNLERLILIYSELVKKLGQQPIISETPIHYFPPTRMKSITTIGAQTCNLPIFRFMIQADTPISLIIEARTPSQWRPDIYPAPLSERFGYSHNEMTALHVERGAREKAQKSRLRILTEKNPVSRFGIVTSSSFIAPETPSSPNGRKTPLSAASSNQNTNRTEDDVLQASAELLGLDSEILAITFRKKTGGVYGHFFKDLSPGVKDMVMQLYTTNKQLIQAEGARMKNVTKKRGNINQPITTMSIMKAKLEKSKHIADYDKGTNSESEMIEEYLIAAKKTERVAIRLQRIFRMRSLRWAQRVYWKRHYGAICLQRIVRGRFARLYFRLLQRIVPIAIQRIIYTYRSYMSRKRMAQWFALVKRAIQVITPILKRFVKKCTNTWLRRFGHAAKIIQSCIRMYLAKIEYYRRVGKRFVQQNLIPAIVRIQAAYRGLRGRRRTAIVLEQTLVRLIDIPAAILMQRVVRGKLGRLIYAHKKLERWAATIIQKSFLRYHQQVKYIKLKQVLLEKFCAIQIQRVFRGRLDREIAAHRRYDKWYHEKCIPAIIKFQATSRRHIAQNKFLTFKLRYKSALVLQLAYRCYKARSEYHHRYQQHLTRIKGKYATKIQTMVRGFIGRKVFKERLYGVVGKRMIAAKVILRAWKNFCNTRRLDSLMVEHRAKLHVQKTLHLKTLREEILTDIVEIQDDIKFSKNIEVKALQRVKVLDDFIVEAHMRLPDLEKGLDTIELEDVERGWGEAYSSEYDMLTQQSIMAREELRLRRVQLRNVREEQLALFLELEDTEMELDRVAVSEVQSYEFLRQSEIEEIYKRVRRMREREVRLERCKWKIKSSRVKVIRRNRGYFNGIREKVCAHTFAVLSSSNMSP
jgi:stress-induced morphogen